MSTNPRDEKPTTKPKTPRERLENETAKFAKNRFLAVTKVLSEDELARVYAHFQLGRLDAYAIVESILKIGQNGLTIETVPTTQSAEADAPAVSSASHVADESATTAIAQE